MKKKNSARAFFLLLMMGGIMLCHNAAGQNYIDEDFLDNIEANAKFMLNEPAPDFKVDATPAKWDKESAVIIGYSRSVQFDRTSRGGFITRKERSLWFIEKDRLKIKLNDNNSVKAFSEIYFRYGAKEDGFIARIIKPDGTITPIDLKAAVGLESTNDVPEYFQSFFDKVANSEYTYYKVPVPGLEPGDILEYVTNTKSKLNVTSSGYIEFDPVYEVCSKKYPILFNEIIIETDDKSFFKFLSLNGAPKFTKENASDKDFFRYVFVDRDRDTEKDTHFVNPFLQYPLVKFQVIYSNSDDVKGALIGEKGELKSEFSQEQLARKAWEYYENARENYFNRYTSMQNFATGCWEELTKLNAKSWSDEKYTDYAYYLLRHKILFNDSYMSDRVFAFCFISLLNRRNIKSELIISIGNNRGKLKEVLFEEEIRYAIKVGDKIFFNLTDFSVPGEKVENMLDNDAYIIYQPAKKGGAQEIKPYKMPGTTASENSTEVTFKTELSADKKRLMVIRTSSYSGLQKNGEIADALKYTTFMLEDYKNYEGKSLTADLRGRDLENYENYIKTLKEDFKKQKPEFVKRQLESEYSQQVKNIHFDVVSDGRSQKQATLTIKEGFELEGFVRKAGRKYLINLPGLIGSQLQIRKEERERKYDIDARYPRSFSWLINFKIPEGYKTQGLAELDKSVENEAGSFSLSAKEENGFIVISLTKSYRQKNIAREKWAEMLAFLDAAYNSTFKYVLLVPNQ